MSEPFRLPKGTHISSVSLIVSDLGKMLTLYCELLGFTLIGKSGSTAEVSASGNRPAQFIFVEQPTASSRSRKSPGLFHTAILFPNRRELASVLKHVHHAGYPFQGFADHGVSEALYLADPEGNGIELYADRPREQWRFTDGQLEMITEPLDVEDLLQEAADNYRMHPDTKIGHIHLQVSSLTKAEQFYHELLGFDVTQRSYPGALFVSAGGYHHHIGLNIWSSRGAQPSPHNTLGLMRFGIEVPTREILEHLKNNLTAAHHSFETFDDHPALLLEDFDNIHIEITSQK